MFAKFCIFLVLLALSQACLESCNNECKAFNGLDSCYSDCNCSPTAQEHVSESIISEYNEILGLYNCSYIFIDACTYAVDYEGCLEEAGCSEITLTTWLISQVPPYLWKAVRPSHLNSHNLVNGFERLKSCSSCAKLIGDDYWDCIDDYCNSSKVSRTSISSELVNGPQAKSFTSCDCYDKCELESESYYACIDSCEYTSNCARKNFDSFAAMKIFMTGKAGSAKIQLDEVKFSCNKACIQKYCKRDDIECFDSCVEKCPGFEGFVAKSVRLEEEGKSIEKNSYFLVVIQFGIMAVMIAVVLVGISKNKRVLETEEVSYQNIVELR